MRLARETWLVTKREASALLVAPLFYVLNGVFFLVGAFTFLALLNTFAIESFRNEADMSANVTQSVIRQTFYIVHFFLLVQVPLLTMRSYSEDRASGALDLLQTTTLGDWALLLGKFFGAFGALLGYLLLTLAFPIATAFVSDPEWPVVWSGFAALVLCAAAYAAIGTFFSSLTESQVVAAVLSYVTLFLFALSGAMKDFLRSPMVADAFRHFSVGEHLEAFLKGTVAPMNVAYFVLLTGLFLFLTARVLESRRWRA